MSRTDVHRPAWVQRRDPLLRREFVAMHHHWERDVWDNELKRWLVTRGAPCDLGDTDGRCQLWPHSRNLFCGCHLCVGSSRRRLARRRERTALRAQLRAAVKTAAAAGRTEADEYDIPAPSRSTW